MKGSQAELDQFLTQRLHTINKLTDRAIGELYRDKLGITLPEARVALLHKSSVRTKQGLCT